MSDFSTFYEHGGYFMHVISAVALAAGLYTAKGLAQIGKTTAGETQSIDDTFRLAVGLVVVAVGVGLLGTLFGFIEASAAANAIPLEQHAKALARGMGVALHTLAWSLMLAIPLTFTVVISRYRVHRRALAVG